jgi:LPXTG-motif cell wall-anchored protein
LRRFMPTSWRKLALAGIAGAATTVAFAAPALACHPVFDSTPAGACVTETTGKVIWTVSPQEGERQELTLVKFTIDGQTVTGEGLKEKDELVKNSKFTLTVPRTANKAALTIGVKQKTNSRNPASGQGTKEFTISSIDWSKCKAPVTPPSEQPSTPVEQPSTPASEKPSTPVEQPSSPSVPASPTESKSSAVAGASSSAASGSLPVTGTSIGIIAGVAVVLLGAGIALFVVARRRRIRFTAA